MVKHRSVSAAAAVRINESAMIYYLLLLNTSAPLPTTIMNSVHEPVPEAAGLFG
jgi:hypothetical protein